MKLLSYALNAQPGFGALRGNDVVPLAGKLGDKVTSLRTLIEHGALDAARRHAETAADTIPLENVRLLPVIPDPSKILCAGLNYEEHRVESGREKTEKPTIFLRVAESQIGHMAPVPVPTVSTQVDYEGEIAVVVGRGGRNIPLATAMDHVFGYSCYNDVSIRDWQRHTTQWIPGKNFDGTGPFGPWLVTADEMQAAAQPIELTTRLNGQVVQHAYSDQMTFSIAEQIAYCSTFTTLRPGDVLVTGTPGGVGVKRNPQLFMKAGDVVEIEVSGVGVLRNPVTAAE